LNNLELKLTVCFRVHYVLANWFPAKPDLNVCSVEIHIVKTTSSAGLILRLDSWKKRSRNGVPGYSVTLVTVMSDAL